MSVAPILLFCFAQKLKRHIIYITCTLVGVDSQCFLRQDRVEDENASGTSQFMSHRFQRVISLAQTSTEGHAWQGTNPTEGRPAIEFWLKGSLDERYNFLTARYKWFYLAVRATRSTQHFAVIPSGDHEI